MNGCIYYCSKIRTYINGSSDPCNKFEKDYSRKTYINDTIYKNGKSYYNDPTPIGAYIFILITLIIVAIAIRKHFTNIEESTFFQGKWEYIKFKIYL